MIQIFILQYQRYTQPIEQSSYWAQLTAPEVGGDSRAVAGSTASTAAPERDADAEQGGRACFVCVDAAAEAVLIECGHGGLCAGESTRTEAHQHFLPSASSGRSASWDVVT